VTVFADDLSAESTLPMTVVYRAGFVWFVSPDERANFQ